jgi:hypothetical protein
VGISCLLVERIGQDDGRFERKGRTMLGIECFEEDDIDADAKRVPGIIQAIPEHLAFIGREVGFFERADEATSCVEDAGADECCRLPQRVANRGYIVDAVTVGGSATVYGASKTRYAPLWQECREVWAELGLRVVSTWIDEAGAGESADLADLWVRCIAEASTADFLIAVHHAGDDWKGAYIEVGAALAAGKPVYICGRPPGSFIHHPLITLCVDVYDAIEDWRAFHFRSEWPGLLDNVELAK